MSPWSYYYIRASRVDDMWIEYRYHGEWIKPGMWKEKEHGYSCLHCEDSLWNHAIRLTERVKQSHADDLQKYNEKHLAFAMAFHPRLGSDSAIKRVGVPVETSGLIYKINM